MAQQRFLLLTAALGLGVFAFVAPGHAEGVVGVAGAQSGASLDFRITIPPVLQLIENRYPHQLPIANVNTGHSSAAQHLVLLSTLRKGFCMELRLAQPHTMDWQLYASGSSAVQVHSSDGGYRVCASRSGRYNIVLNHVFSPKHSGPVDGVNSSDWPVSVALAAL